jgi:hypothetical protein
VPDGFDCPFTTQSVGLVDSIISISSNPGGPGERRSFRPGSLYSRPSLGAYFGELVGRPCCLRKSCSRQPMRFSPLLTKAKPSGSLCCPTLSWCHCVRVIKLYQGKPRGFA